MSAQQRISPDAQNLPSDKVPLTVPKDEIALMEEGLQKGEMATDEHEKIVSGMTQGQKEDLKEFAQSTEMKD